jgi:hypothetical protein
LLLLLLLIAKHHNIVNTNEDNESNTHKLLKGKKKTIGNRSERKYRTPIMRVIDDLILTCNIVCQELFKNMSVVRRVSDTRPPRNVEIVMGAMIVSTHRRVPDHDHDTVNTTEIGSSHDSWASHNNLRASYT